MKLNLPCTVPCIRKFILNLIRKEKPQLRLGSVRLRVTNDPRVARMPWRCHYWQNEDFLQYIEVSVDASPEDIVSYFLSDIGRGAIAETQAANSQNKKDRRLARVVEKVGES
jgi:hypothetical protein